MMKPILITSLLLLLLVCHDGLAQGRANSRDAKYEQKKGGPPPWAPAHGYRAKTRYVYFKDYDVYYDHNRGVYISISGGKWVVSAKIPAQLSNVNLVMAAKIDLDFDGDDPQRDHDRHKKQYPPGKK